MLNINVSKKAQLFLSKIPKKHAQQIVQKIDQLAADPNSLPTKQLQGFPQFHRAKSGAYRIIYRIENQQLMLYIVRIGKRNDGEVYDNLDALDD
jgi:mRNA interferase RelE/StbE